MKRIASLLIILSVVMVVSAQADQPAQEPAPPAEQVPVQPAQPGVVPPHGLLQSMVRFVHAAPNVEIERLVLVDTVGRMTREEIEGLEYLEVTDYIPVLEGNHEVIVDLAGIDDEEPVQVILDHTVGAIGGHFYTVAIIGLAMPTDPGRADEGFLAWLEGLFTPDRDDLSLRTVVVEDIATVGVSPTESDVRILHAAPGTDNVDLVLVQDDVGVEVLATVDYSEVSAHSIISPDVGWLEVRVAGSDLTLVDLSGVDLTPGQIHTVILAGTPIEDVPIEALVLKDEWMDPMAIPPRAPGAVAAPHAWPAADAAWMSERLLEVEAWLVDAQQRLDTLREEEEPAAEAVRDINEARMLLEQIRLQFEGMTAPMAPQQPPVEQPVEPAPEEEPEEAPAN